MIQAQAQGQTTASKYLSSHGKTRRTKRGLCFRRWDHTPPLSDFRRSVKLVCDFWIEADQAPLAWPKFGEEKQDRS
ncbi:hypothetical protein FOBRF1_004122 [Fusarium oxysporum]